MSRSRDSTAAAKLGVGEQILHLLFWLSVSWKVLVVDKQIPLKTGRRVSPESCLRVYKVEVIIIKLFFIYVISLIPCSWSCSSPF